MTMIIPQRYRSTSGLAYIRCGSGPVLVLIHGVGLRLEAWCNQLADLVKQFTVCALDMPGHGNSDWLLDCTDVRSYANVIARWIQAEVGTPVLVAGHSMGALIALDLAIHHTQLCTGVVALNAVYRRSAQAQKAVLARVQEMDRGNASVDVTAPVARWFADQPSDAEAEYAQWCRQWLQAAPLAGYRQAYKVFCQYDGPAEAELCALSLPALFMTGRDDPNSLPAMSQRMAQLCPYGNVHVLENARHMAPLTHAPEINSRLITFAKACFAAVRESVHESS